MKYIRLQGISDESFSMAWDLYEASFPIEERRLIPEQVQIFTNSTYHCEVIFNDGKFLGIFWWWDFSDLRYVEYFATVPGYRGQGFGAAILHDFINKNDKPILLEVELPYNSLNRRRIKFYERQGFKLNHHFYEIPPTREGMPAVELKLMTFPNQISEQDVFEFKKLYFPLLLNPEAPDPC